MEHELLAWAQVAARELMYRCHLSLQTLLMVTLFQSQPSTRAVLKNYLPYLQKPSDSLSVCRLYARAGLVEELRQAMQEQPLSNSEMYHVIRAGTRGGHWSVLEPFFEQPHYRYCPRIPSECLMSAVKRGHLEIVRRIACYRSIKSELRASLAQKAARSGRVDIFKALLSAGTIDPLGIHDVLVAAVKSGPEMVKAALEGLWIPFYILEGVAQVACQMPGSTIALVSLFVELQPQLLNSLLIFACQKCNLEVAQYILDRGASALDDALKACYEHRNLELVQLLLDRGARDPKGYLVAHGGSQVAALVLRVGACEPQQALSQDALYFMPDILRLVLAAGPVDLESALRKALAILPCQPQALGSVVALVEAGARLPEGDPLYGQTLESCLRLAKSGSSDSSSRAAAVEYMAGLAGVSVHDASARLPEVLAKHASTRLPEVPAKAPAAPEVPMGDQADFEDYYFDY